MKSVLPTLILIASIGSTACGGAVSAITSLTQRCGSAVQNDERFLTYTDELELRSRYGRGDQALLPQIHTFSPDCEQVPRELVLDRLEEAYCSGAGLQFYAGYSREAAWLVSSSADEVQRLTPYFLTRWSSYNQVPAECRTTAAGQELQALHEQEWAQRLEERRQEVAKEEEATLDSMCLEMDAFFMQATNFPVNGQMAAPPFELAELDHCQGLAAWEAVIAFANNSDGIRNGCSSS